MRINQNIVLVVTFSLAFLFGYSQKVARVGYIDMDYILENVSEYKRAEGLLDKQVVKWKQSIEKKKLELQRMQTELQSEKVMLTDELIEDKLIEIKQKENEIISAQTQYFGPRGVYFIQKNKLLAPVQDQVLTLVAQIAKERKYDMIFDRSSDLTIIYSSKNYDISNLVLKRINAQEKRKSKIEQIQKRKEQIELQVQKRKADLQKVKQKVNKTIN